MQQQNWWDQDAVSQPQAPAAQPSPFGNRPVIRQGPDPMDAERLRIQQEQLRVTQDNAARAAAKDQRDTEKGSWGSVDSAFAKDFVDWRASGGYADVRKQLEQLNEARTSLESGSANLTGPVVGRVPDAVNSFINPKAISTRESVEEVVQRALRLILGAQFTEKEGERLIARAYNPALDEKENAKRVGRLVEQLDAMAKAKEAAADYFEQNGSLKGYQGPTFGGSDLGADLEAAPQEANPLYAELEREYRAAGLEVEFDENGKPLPVLVGGSVGKPAEPNASPFMAGVGDLAQGVGELAGLVANPLNAGINAIAGTNLSTDMGQAFRDATGIPQGNPLASAINRGGIMGLSGAGLARGAAPLATGALESGLSRFGAAPLTDLTAGAASGGSAELARPYGPVAQGAAALLGGGATVPLSMRVAGRMGSGVPQVTENALLRAGQAESVDVNRAMIDPNAQQKTIAVGKTMAGGPMLQRGMNKVEGQIKGRVDDLTPGGTPLEEVVGGRVVDRTAQRYIKTSGQQFNRRYGALEREAAGVKVPPTKALAEVDGIIAKLSETPEQNAAEIAFLNKMRKDFQGELSVAALRRNRTSLRKRISKGELTFGENEADVLAVMDAASDDITAGLVAAGKPGLARAFRQVDGDYRQRMEFINGTVQKIIGKRGANLPPGKIMANLRAMTAQKGDNEGFARIMRDMEPEDRLDIAATIAEGLGKNQSGQFDTGFLFKRIDQLPRSVQVAAFGEEGAQSLANISVLAREHNRVAKALGGSPTGVANDYRSWIVNLMFGGGAGLLSQSGATGLAVAATGAGAKVGRDVMSARMLLNKDVTKWARQAPRTTNPKAINDHFARLNAIATRNPAIAPDIQQFIRAANDNAARTGQAAASPNERPEDEE